VGECNNERREREHKRVRETKVKEDEGPTKGFKIKKLVQNPMEPLILHRDS
jgi:hypothetical protein